MVRATGIQRIQQKRPLRGYWSLPVRVVVAASVFAAALAIVGVLPSYDGFGRHVFLPEVSGDGVVGLAFITLGAGLVRAGRRRGRRRVPSRGPAA